MNESHEIAEGFDNSPEGQALVALLQKHAPPAIDSRAGSRAVLMRLQPQGRLHVLRWLGPATGAAAAVIVALFIFGPDRGTPVEPTIGRLAPDPVPSAAEIRHDREFPEIVATVRGPSADGLLIDAGLKDGLRVGDELIGPGGVKARVTAAGIFEARISTDSPISRGAEVRARVSTEAQKRAARFTDFGGDPGAFLEFGVLVSATPLNEARMLGLSDGAALRVDEAIGVTMKDAKATPNATLASRLDLRAGDVIVEVNGASVRTVNEFAQALGWSLDPKRLTIRVLRGGKQLDLKL
jgi:hypothetical protein